MPLDHVSLCAIQKDVEKTKKHYEYCSSLPFGTKRAMCFHGFKEIVLSAKNSFLWPLKASDSKAGRARYGCLFFSYGSMTLLLALISKVNIKHIGDIQIQKTWEFQFKSDANRMYAYLNLFEQAVANWRTDQITPVQICDINIIFWKEYKMNCEARWRRDASDDGNFISSPQFPNSNQTTSGKKENYIIFKDNDPDLNIADNIGGYGSRFDKTFRASVTDPLNKYVIYNYLGRVHANQNRADILTNMYKEGFKKRQKYILNILKDVWVFNNKTVSALRHVFDTFGKVYEEL